MSVNQQYMLWVDLENEITEEKNWLLNITIAPHTGEYKDTNYPYLIKTDG